MVIYKSMTLNCILDACSRRVLPGLAARESIVPVFLGICIRFGKSACLFPSRKHQPARLTAATRMVSAIHICEDGQLSIWNAWDDVDSRLQISGGGAEEESWGQEVSGLGHTAGGWDTVEISRLTMIMEL